MLAGKQPKSLGHQGYNVCGVQSLGLGGPPRAAGHRALLTWLRTTVMLWRGQKQREKCGISLQRVRNIPCRSGAKSSAGAVLIWMVPTNSHQWDPPGELRIWGGVKGKELWTWASPQQGSLLQWFSPKANRVGGFPHYRPMEQQLVCVWCPPFALGWLS